VIDSRTTLHALVAAARRRLTAAGIRADEADLDARLLAEHILGWTTERFLADAIAPASPEFGVRYDALVERRVRREPLAYIIRRQEFWGLDFEVSPAVLIPRPETELVVESALGFVQRDAHVHIADVCTGSGCMAIALACERPNARVTATEISNAALEVARRNAVRQRVAERVSLVRSDLLGGVEGPFDVVVANPPYVADRERATVQPEVRDYEPALALFSGPDGLDVIRRLVPAAASRLRPLGMLAFEFGFGQADAVTELIARTADLALIELRRDLQGIERVAVARKTELPL